MSAVGGYSLDLYCDNYDHRNRGDHKFDEFPINYSGELGSTCRAEARKDGWIIKDHGTIAICPKCNPSRNK